MMGIFKVQFQVEESIEIQASKKEVWDYLIDLEKKNQWSPWVILEKNCEQESEGKPGTIDYTEAWKGSVIGEGMQTIKEVKNYNYLKSSIFFVKPFKSKNIVEFFLEEKESITTVRWKMTGTLLIFLFFMKKQMMFFIKSDFKRGLNMLKKLVETGDLKTKTEFLGELELNKRYYLYFEGAGELEIISKKMGEDFKELQALLDDRKLEAISYFTIYEKADIINNYFEYRACVEISHEQYDMILIYGSDELNYSTLKSQKYIKTSHFGSYEFLSNSWTGAFMYAKANKYKINPKKPSIEIYENFPLTGNKPEDYITHILLEIK